MLFIILIAALVWNFFRLRAKARASFAAASAANPAAGSDIQAVAASKGAAARNRIDPVVAPAVPAAAPVIPVITAAPAIPAAAPVVSLEEVRARRAQWQQQAPAAPAQRVMLVADGGKFLKAVPVPVAAPVVPVTPVAARSHFGSALGMFKFQTEARQAFAAGI